MSKRKKGFSKSTKFLLVQVPITSFAIWYLGWILYRYLNLWQSISLMVYQNILGLWMIAYVFIALEVVRRQVKRGERGMKVILCPSCKRPATTTSQLKPFEVVFQCANPLCPLASAEARKKAAAATKPEAPTVPAKTPARLLSRKAMLALSCVAIVAIALGFGLGRSWQMTEYSISTMATVKALGVDVWSDPNATLRVGAINWGMLEPGGNATRLVYVQNSGNAPANLTMWTEDWSPANVTNWISLSWDCEGVTLEVDEMVAATFTLSVNSSIVGTGLTAFSFIIVISGWG